MIRLSDHIAAAGGWLSLEAFMQLALHHPQEGYYSSSIENIGQRGDFSTTPTLSPILAKAIAAHWKEACSRCGRRLPLLELGAGSGALAVKILERLGFWNRLNTDYVIVESSPRLREFQHLLLGGRAKIYSTMEKALKHCGGKAFIFSNELVDAFPARVFEYTEQDWKEGSRACREKRSRPGRTAPRPAAAAFLPYAGIRFPTGAAGGNSRLLRALVHKLAAPLEHGRHDGHRLRG